MRTPSTPEDRIEQIDDLARRYIRYMDKLRTLYQSGNCQHPARDWGCCAGHQALKSESAALVEEAKGLGIVSEGNPLSETWWKDAGHKEAGTRAGQHYWR